MKIFDRNNATHVVTSTSNIMTSLFDLAYCQFARDAYPKAHSKDFLQMLISYVSFVKI